MINFSDKICTKNQNTHTFNVFPKIVQFVSYRGKIWYIRQATSVNTIRGMRIACG